LGRRKNAGVLVGRKEGKGEGTLAPTQAKKEKTEALREVMDKRAERKGGEHKRKNRRREGGARDTRDVVDRFASKKNPTGKKERTIKRGGGKETFRLRRKNLGEGRGKTRHQAAMCKDNKLKEKKPAVVEAAFQRGKRRKKKSVGGKLTNVVEKLRENRSNRAEPNRAKAGKNKGKKKEKFEAEVPRKTRKNQISARALGGKKTKRAEMRTVGPDRRKNGKNANEFAVCCTKKRDSVRPAPTLKGNKGER